MILLGPAGGRGNSDMSFCLARGVVKCVRPLWTTLPMEDGDEVPETIEPPPQEYACLRLWSLKGFALGLVLASQNQTLEETASELREGFPGRINRHEGEPGR